MQKQGRLFRALLVPISLAVLMIALPGQCETLTYQFVGSNGTDQLKGTFSYDTAGDLYRQIVPLSLKLNGKALIGNAAIYLAPNASVLHMQACSASFGIQFGADGYLPCFGKHADLAIHLSGLTDLTRPLPLPVLPESNYHWWNDTSSSIVLTLKDPLGEHAQHQDDWYLSRRAQVYLLILFGTVFLISLGYYLRYRQSIKMEVGLMVDQVRVFVRSL